MDPNIQILRGVPPLSHVISAPHSLSLSLSAFRTRRLLSVLSPKQFLRKEQHKKKRRKTGKEKQSRAPTFNQTQRSSHEMEKAKEDPAILASTSSPVIDNKDEFNHQHGAVSGALHESPVLEPNESSSTELLIDPESAHDDAKVASDAGHANAVLKSSKIPQKSTNAVLNQRNIDTAAPIESVKAAVSKFGRIVDKSSQKTQITESNDKQIQLKLEKLNEELPKYRQQCEAAEVLKVEVLSELDHAKRLVDELRLNLEKAEMQEAQAKRDSERAELRARQMEQGIGNNANAAASTHLVVAKERYASAVGELSSAKQELEALQRAYASLVQERDMAIRKAQDSVSSTKEMEKSAEELRHELIATKQLLEAAHSAHLEAEERRMFAALALEQDKRNCEKELKQAEDEVQQLNGQLSLTNDLKLKLDAACALATSLKAELDSYVEAKLSQGDTSEEEANARAALAVTRKELAEVKATIEKAKDEVNFLRIASSSLKSELEKEQATLTTLREREALASMSVSSLEAEFNRATTELDLIMTREKDAREKMVDLPKTLEHAAQEADQTKSVAILSREELRKAREEAEQAKAAAVTMQTRLEAVLKEIEATKASTKLATSAFNALRESQDASIEWTDSPTSIRLPVEEYYKMSKKAHDAEELFGKRVNAAMEQIEAAKESETKNYHKLQEAQKELEERKVTFQDAAEKAEQAKGEKMEVEDELRKWRAEHEQRRKEEGEGTQGLDEADGGGHANGYAAKGEPGEESSTTTTTAAEETPTSSELEPAPKHTKTRRRSFFPRVVMFLARKKAQSLK